MTDLEALHRAILEDPADDTVRLAYADALDERGEKEDSDRAEHIRWAIANPQNRMVCLCLNGKRQPQPCEVCQMFGKEVDGIPRRSSGETHYIANRGFVSEIRNTQETFLEHASDLFRMHPIEKVVLVDRVPYRGGPGQWIWWNRNEFLDSPEEEDELTPVIYNLLPREDDKSNTGIRKFWTKLECEKVLSDSCVRYGRELVGLPPLTVTLETAS